MRGAPCIGQLQRGKGPAVALRRSLLCLLLPLGGLGAIASPALAQDQGTALPLSETAPATPLPDDAPPAATAPVALGFPAPATGIVQADMRKAPLLILDQDRMFQQSNWGAAAIDKAEAGAAALNIENREIAAALEQEEEALTRKRSSMAPEAFSPLAAEFDRKAEEHRERQDAKLRALNRTLDEDRQKFHDLAEPVMQELLVQHEAVAVIASEAVINALPSADVTDEAIALLNQRLPAPEASMDAAPEPTAVPEAAPGAPPADPASDGALAPAPVPTTDPAPDPATGDDAAD